MFTFAVTLPYAGSIRVHELTNREIFNIIKYCSIEDVEGLNSLFETAVFSKLPPLNLIDKFYLLLYYRSLYFGSVLQIKIKHEKAKHMDVFIDNMLEKIQSLSMVENHIEEYNNCKIELSVPYKLFFNSMEDIVFDCIKSITFDSASYDLTTLSSKEKDEILKYLPTNFTNKVFNYFHYIGNTLKDLPMIDNYPEYEVEGVNISVISNDPLKFIMAMFNQDMVNFLSFMYHYVNKVGGTMEDFFNLTFNDAKIILDFYKEEVIKQQESLNNNKK